MKLALYMFCFVVDLYFVYTNVSKYVKHERSVDLVFAAIWVLLACIEFNKIIKIIL